MLRYAVSLIVLLPAFSAAAAAATKPTCVDYLVRVPQKSYHCKVVTTIATSPEFDIVFGENPGSSTTFNLVVGSSLFNCACDPNGAVKDVSQVGRFYQGKSFTCIKGEGFSDAIMYKGRVAGKDGSKLISLIGLGIFGTDASGNFGSCVVNP